MSASKLELLHQRITKRDYTSGYSVNPANEFPGVQGFFKELTIKLMDNTYFYKHLIDTLVHKIDVLNTMEWATELQEGLYYLRDTRDTFKIFCIYYIIYNNFYF